MGGDREAKGGEKHRRRVRDKSVMHRLDLHNITEVKSNHRDFMHRSKGLGKRLNFSVKLHSDRGGGSSRFLLSKRASPSSKKKRGGGGAY